MVVVIIWRAIVASMNSVGVALHLMNPSERREIISITQHVDFMRNGMEKVLEEVAPNNSGEQEVSSKKLDCFLSVSLFMIITVSKNLVNVGYSEKYKKKHDRKSLASSQ
jgi:hypothetical protein